MNRQRNRNIMRTGILIPVILMFTVLAACSAERAEQAVGESRTEVTPAELLRDYSGSVVQVEYRLRYDAGLLPPMRYSPYSPSYSRGSDEADWSVFIDEERPVIRPGYVVGRDLVATTDPALPERFIKSINIHTAGGDYPATVQALARNTECLILKVRGEADLQPIVFDDEAGEAARWLRLVKSGEGMLLGSGMLGNTTWEREGDGLYRTAPPASLLLDVNGEPVGMTFSGELSGDVPWRGSPLAWPSVDINEYKDKLKRLRERMLRQVPRIGLKLRSPRRESLDDQFDRYRAGYGHGGRDAPQLTQWDGPGIMLDNQMVLVLANFRPATTARIEKITVHPAEDQALEASFVASLRDFGGFLAKLQQPLGDDINIAGGNISDYRHELLLQALVSVHGQERLVQLDHQRLKHFHIGMGGMVYPDLAPLASDGHSYTYYDFVHSYGADLPGRYLFNTRGELVAAPVELRTKLTVERERDLQTLQLVPVVYISEVLADINAHADKNNVPLSEAEENRLAWLGVELQRLDAELARFNDLTDLTNDGDFGAIVTYVYPGSPADRAGIRMGDVLLKIYVKDQPKPLEVHGTSYGSTAFPWENYDELPAEYILGIRRPWPTVQSRLTTALTDLGFGTPYELEYVHEGEVKRVHLTAEQSPPHYASAPRYKDRGLGLTVRDLTYELRRYFHKRDNDPGVIISDVEPGSRAATAGLKPYEIITYINDQPVHDVQEFREMVGSADILRFEVLRMNRRRIVRVQKPARESKTEEQD